MEQSIAIQQIKKTVQEILPGAKIFLFGSRARKTNQEKSDYDLMVVIPKTIPSREKINFESKICKALASLSIDADILLNSDEELKTKSTLPGHIVQDVLNEGIVL